MSNEIRIAGIGEILMDVFEDGSATLGGAPFNVAFHASQLLAASGRGRADFVSAVGDDPWGRHISEALEASHISRQYLAIDPEHPTGTALVFVSGANAGFEIAPISAWDFLVATEQTAQLAARLDAVAFGSLAQRRPESGAVIRGLVGQVKGHRLYDINLRRNTTDGVRGYSAEIIDQSCRIATLLKANDGELEEVCAEFGFSCNDSDLTERQFSQMARIRSHYRLKGVVVTRGSKGALLLAEDESIRLADSTLAQDRIHPVGAGDAFSAGLLYGLTRNLPIGVSALIADKLASWVTSFASATPALSELILGELTAIETGAGWSDQNGESATAGETAR
jgi:fructokinase